jgi:acetolactate decarboxylase
MPDLTVKIPRSISDALADRASKSWVSVETIVNLALSEYLNTPLHTLFQVSTSGALVAGVYDKQVSVQTILEHGDFGLGTFAHLSLVATGPERQVCSEPFGLGVKHN